MKLIAVNLQLPKQVDDHYKTEAKRRCASKSFVIREVLTAHVEEIKKRESEASLPCSQSL